MKIKNGKIVESTENELYSYWLDQWSDLMSFNDYKDKMINTGVTILKEEIRTEEDIDKLLNEIKSYWKKHSNLSFGQVITQKIKTEDLSYIEDSEILKLFHKNK